MGRTALVGNFGFAGCGMETGKWRLILRHGYEIDVYEEECVI